MIGMNSSQLRGVVKRQGFTIVELLVVVVVIGILSVITVVSYTGITQQANVARMQVELESAYKKLNMFYTENDTYPVDLSAAKTAGLIPTDTKTNEIYVADNSVNPAYYCYSYTTGTETYAIDSSSSVSKGGCLTNLVTNGDFSNGTTGWRKESCNFSSITDSRLSFIGSGTNQNFGIYSAMSPATQEGHKYYQRFSMRTFDDGCESFSVAYNGAPAAVIFSPSKDTIYTLSRVWTQSSSTYNLIFAQSKWADAAAAAGKTFDVGYVLALDLTEAFGAGNEPTAAQMDAMLAKYPDSWFDGTKKGSLFW